MKKKLFITISIVIFIVVVLISLHNSVNTLKVNHYNYVENMQSYNEKMNIVALSDLHDHSFGENNNALISEVASQSPDIILLGGDILNSYSENSDNVCDLVKKLSNIAPVYYGLGNHELEYMEHHNGLISELTAAGAIVLDKEYVDTKVNGVDVRIGGLYDYAFNLAKVEDKRLAEDRREIKAFLKTFEDTDAFKIMISHRPDSFIFADAASSWDIDLVVSGHLHGGQVVLPLLGGVYGGDQGNFPEYVHGMYEKENIHLFVTSGLGTNKKIVPRFNNRPEIAVISIK